jgi:beta-phosphoglucomutase-like phosphatase (HAD superfamily)
VLRRSSTRTTTAITFSLSAAAADSGTLVIEEEAKRSTVSRDKSKTPTQSWRVPFLPGVEEFVRAMN